jgi:tetratricopeptide (TPR) repeat protein
MKVNIDSFFNEYKGVIPRELFGRMSRAMLNGETDLEISDVDYNRTLYLKQEQVKRVEALARCAKLNNEGTAYEKECNIDEAIRCYEQNIGENAYPACHAYDRLMVIYRKRKDYDSELRVIDEALKYLCATYGMLREKYEERKQRVLSLKGRQ